jgi:ATP-dependent exoDNAse (exonuclease V) alpha subunit
VASTLKRSRTFNSRQWGVGGEADLAPPDPNATRLTCTVIGMSPRFIAQDGSFAIWPAIWEIAGEDRPRQITIKGALGRVNPGEMLACHGRWRKHQQHGWSFDVTDYQSALPQSAGGVATWLQTKVDGIGKTFAEAIVAHFGHQHVFEILDADPQRLQEVRTAKGRPIPERQLAKAIAAWDDVKAIRQIETFLFSHGVSANLADKLYRFYGPEVVDILQTDPYRITQLRGIGFKIADRIALSLGTPIEHPSRLRAGMLFVLDEAESDGHAFLTLQQLLSKCFETLNVQDPHKLVAEATELAKNGKIVAEADEIVQQRVYSKNMYDIECRLSRMIRHMLESPRAALMPQPERPRPRTGASKEEIAALRLPSDDQWSVVETVRNQRLAMLTGGPGTGKCVRGDTPILINGRYIPAAEVWSRYAIRVRWDEDGWWADSHTTLVTNSLNEHGKIVEMPFTRLWRQPVREFGRRIRCEDGSEVVATKAHHFHGLNGWTNNIAVGDVLCLAPTIKRDGQTFEPELTKGANTLIHRHKTTFKR